MFQERVTESPEKTKQRLEHRESRADSNGSFQGDSILLQLQTDIGQPDCCGVASGKTPRTSGKELWYSAQSDWRGCRLLATNHCTRRGQGPEASN